MKKDVIKYLMSKVEDLDVDINIKSGNTFVSFEVLNNEYSNDFYNIKPDLRKIILEVERDFNVKIFDVINNEKNFKIQLYVYRITVKFIQKLLNSYLNKYNAFFEIKVISEVNHTYTVNIILKYKDTFEKLSSYDTVLRKLNKVFKSYSEVISFRHSNDYGFDDIFEVVFIS